MKSVLAGATGLIGSHVRKLAGPDCKPLLRGQVDYGNLAASLGDLPVDRVYCALGTTIRKAGSQAAFRQVDFDYALALARWARQQGCGDFRLVSSVGADKNSSNFYLRVKGEIEEALAGEGFRQLHIFRPGVLLGDRQESRPGESIGKALSVLLGPLMLGGLSKYRATPASAVAHAMVHAPDASGVHVYHWREIISLGR